jgi:ribonuclease BN (tRNA processing enzyme)
MQVRFVGCGDAFGSGGRYNTCFHVTGESANFLIDCGASSLPALKRLGIVRDDIDLILITHFHGDHFAGLPFLLLDAQFSRRTRPLVIAGPQGIEMRLTQVMEALFENSSETKQRFELSVVALEPEQSRRFRSAMAIPAARSWPTGSRPRAASSPTAPTPNGRRRWFRPRVTPICSSPRRIITTGSSRITSA